MASWQEYVKLLEDHFDVAQKAYLDDTPPHVSDRLKDLCSTLFQSKTQAYREVLLGCLLIRLFDRTRDIRLPYLDLGENAYSGRSLDEQVVNPFLREQGIPCSKGPYLNVFRRQVRFDGSTRAGLKDKEAYDAFLESLGVMVATSGQEPLLEMLDYVLYRFVLFREESKVSLIPLPRISLRQCAQIIDMLLDERSGGRFPVMLILAMIDTLRERFNLPWQVDYQEINVADKASGAGGDIAISEGGKYVMTIEVTERQVDANRLRGTYRDKILVGQLSDYVFLVGTPVAVEAKDLAEKYFAQGHDVNFVDIRSWLFHTLVTVGRGGRDTFRRRMVDLLSPDSVPKVLKLMWNKAVGDVSA